jgi:hypothetical protein
MEIESLDKGHRIDDEHILLKAKKLHDQHMLNKEHIKLVK